MCFWCKGRVGVVVFPLFCALSISSLERRALIVGTVLRSVAPCEHLLNAMQAEMQKRWCAQSEFLGIVRMFPARRTIVQKRCTWYLLSVIAWRCLGRNESATGGK